MLYFVNSTLTPLYTRQAHKHHRAHSKQLASVPLMVTQVSVGQFWEHRSTNRPFQQ